VGEVSTEDDDYFGDPVIEAARLCATCESGQVLATDVVRLMAGQRSRHEHHSLGPMSLKGLSDPVEIVEVLWEPLGVTDTGLTTRITNVRYHTARIPAVWATCREGLGDRADCGGVAPMVGRPLERRAATCSPKPHQKIPKVLEPAPSSEVDPVRQSPGSLRA
jgi:hypothetical protein